MPFEAIFGTEVSRILLPVLITAHARAIFSVLADVRSDVMSSLDCAREKGAILSFCKLLGVEKWLEHCPDLDGPQSTSVDLDSNFVTPLNVGFEPSNPYIREERVAAISWCNAQLLIPK